jgi:hypothetical protein
MAADSPASFSLDLSKFVNRVPVNAEKAFKKIVLDMYTRVAKRTRVDTGLARGNWQVAVGSPPTTAISRRSKTVDPTIALRELADYDIRKEQSVHIVNHLHYIQPLENGTENREGDHMLSRTVAEFHRFVAEASSILAGGV